MIIMKTLLHHLRISIVATLALSILLCGIYPLIVWGLAQAIFPVKANGSLIVKDGQVRGSALLGQNFMDAKYFHPRPSAAGNGYDATSSGGTNLGPLSDKLINGIHKKMPDGKDDPANFDGVKDLVDSYRKENGLNGATPVPADAITRSGSGLDPHISRANALMQLPRVAKARGFSNEAVQKLVDENTNARDLGILGESGVNVVRLNLALDAQR
jgi:K+-transporting ATPase ATPase C chain